MNEQKPVDLEAIRVRANAATEGPWVKSVCQIMPFSGSQQDSWHKYRDDSWDVFRGCFVGGLLQRMAIRVCRIMAGSEDAAFIAHSRQDIPALCDEVEVLRAQVKELEGRYVIKDCEWHLNEPDWDGWEPSCGNQMLCLDDGPLSNGYRFCPYCKGKIIERPADDNEEGDQP